jgi:DNA-binding transcriptional MerR regulator
MATPQIPDKLFFKIGEVCELVDVQPHVLRYWESEFPTLAPQKNRAGQRVYRKRDVEMALRIKELLYEDQYTIAGAKKRLANELRTGGKLRLVPESDVGHNQQMASGDLGLTENGPRSEEPIAVTENAERVSYRTIEERKALRQVATELRELLGLLEAETKASGSSGK